MGVDIYGINPNVTRPKPQINWELANDEQRDAYFKELNEYETEFPGTYFRSNWWGWRPIQMVCELADEKYDLGIDFTYWGSNDGAGLKTADECIALATALEDLFQEYFVKEDVERIQLCLGSWVDRESGQFVHDTADDLNAQYPLYTILSTAVVDGKGRLVESSHSVGKNHLLTFIAFLKECGGFEIW